MSFDYKKEYKEFYLPPQKPQILTVPAMNFVAVHGKGDPNDPAGEYMTLASATSLTCLPIGISTR